MGSDRGIAVVCVHGFTGSPHDLDYLRGKLDAAGLATTAPTLPGHETTVQDLDRRTWREWAEAVDAAVTTAAAGPGTPRVALVGQSLGGLLALHVAAHRRDVARVASLAAPLWLEGLSRVAAKYAARLGVRMLPKLGGSDIRDQAMKAQLRGYDRIPVRALGQLVEFMGVVDGELGQIAKPVLVLHGAQDHTAPLACAARIADRTRAHRLRIFPQSYHLLASDVDRDAVAEEVLAFVTRETV